MHIPGGFSGGFRPHKGFVERKNVELVYRKLQNDRAAKTAKNAFSLKIAFFWLRFLSCEIDYGKLLF